MAQNKKSLLEHIKNLAKSESSKEQEERKKKLAEEKIKETAKGGNGDGENSASLKCLTVLERQLLEKSVALEAEAAKRRELEEKVQKYREEEIRRESEQKVNESKQTLNTILQLVESFNPEDETKEKASQKKPKKQGNKAAQEKTAFNKQKANEGNDNMNKSGKKTNFGGNLNNPDQSVLNKCENKLFDKQNVPHFTPPNIPPLLPSYNQPPMQNNQPNNFNQPGPMNSNSLPLYPNLNQSQQYFNQPPMSNQPYPNQNPFSQNPNNFGPINNFNQPGPGFNAPPAGFNTFHNQDGNLQHNQHQFRGRGGFNRGRGNFRGNERGENFARGGNSRGGNFRGNGRNENFRGNVKGENFRGNNRRQFGGNNGPTKLGAQEKDGFIVVSKDDIPRKPGGRNSSNVNVNQLGGGDHSQNNQKTNFKKKRNRNRPERLNKEEKEKEEELDNDSVMQGMIDVFSKMFGSMTSQPAKPKTETPQTPAAVSPGPNQLTGAIKKDTGKPRNKANKKKDGNQQPNDNKDAKNNPLKLFVGEYPSEEEALARNINPREANNNKSGEDIPAIRITNLSERTRLNDLEGLVKPFGLIKKRYLALNRETGVCKGFAYVHFQHKKSAEKAIEVLNGYLYDDLKLSVQWTFPANKN